MTPPSAMSRVGRHTLVYGLGILLGRAVSFVMLPFYTHYLAPADYGVMQLVDMTLDIVSIFAGSRLASGVFLFYHRAESDPEKLAVLSTAFLLLMASFGAFAAATAWEAPAVSRLVFGDPGQATLIRLAAASLGVQALVTVPLALLRLEERSVRFTVVTSVKLVLQLTLNIVFLAVFGLGVKGIFVSSLMANTLMGVWLGVPFLFRAGLRFSKRWARGLLRYGLPLMATQLATFVVTFGDRYFLRVHADITAVGIYSLAYQFGFILTLVGFQPFSTMWEALRFDFAKRPDRDDLYARAFVFMNVLLLTVALGIGLFIGDFIRVMANPAYQGAAALVPIILVAYVLQAWALFAEVGVLVKERTEYITFVNWLAAGAALLGYALLIPPWHAYGAAVATVLAFAVRQVATYVTSQRLWPLRYQWGPVWRLVAVTVAVYGASLAIPKLPLWESILVRCSLLVVYSLLVWISHVVGAEDRDRFRMLIGAAWGRLR
jgi:O-antigen/teichoic acid export membrane protein